MKSPPKFRVERWGMPPRGIGARSVTSIGLFAMAAIVLWQMEVVRADYWAQLSPWVPFLAGAFAVVAGTLAFRFWRLGERSEYYFRIGERLPFGGETALGLARGQTLLVGHAPQVETIDFPPVVQRLLYIGIASCVGLVTVTNRAVALLREVPAQLDRPSREFCAEPELKKPVEAKVQPGCKLVRRAYQLGYTKKLGTCAPEAATAEAAPVELCRKRQLDEPYLHYAWRLLDTRTREILTTGGGGRDDSFGEQLDYLETLLDATADAIAMQPRSSHHLFTNLHDPRGSLIDRARAALDRGACGSRLSNLAHFPQIADPARLLEHVLAQLLFNAVYKPVVAECREIVVHWDAPPDACAQLAANPQSFLADRDVLDGVVAVLDARRTRAELVRHGAHQQAGELATAQRIVSFQCLVVGDTESASPVERTATIDGEAFVVRETRTTSLSADGASQIRLYKHLAELLAEGFGYGRLTSNQAIGARPEESTMAASFRDPGFLLTKLDLLRDADLFLGNEWLAKRPDLLDAYPYHLHLQTFVEIFRRQYRLHRGRL